MRVALINNFPPNSGAGRYAYTLAVALKKLEGIECELICMNPMKAEDLTLEINKNVKFLNRFPYLKHPYLSRVLTYFINPIRIRRGYDLYHLANHMVGIFARFAFPSIVTVWDVIQLTDKVDLGNGALSWIYNFLLVRSIKSIGCTERIICPSECTRDELLQTSMVDPGKIRVIYPGLDHDLFRPMNKRECRIKLGLPLHEPILLHVGSEISRKNVSSLIKCLSILQKQNEQITLVRVGAQSESIINLIQEFHLQEAVIYFGEIQAEEVPYFLGAADLFVFPSFKEGFGLPLLEAMACGCPVIAGNSSALPEVVGDAGVLVDPLDVNGLAACTQELLGDEERRRELSKRGIQRAADFSWAKCAIQTLEVYKEIVG